MSNIKDELKLPSNLPECSCFTTADLFTLTRCSEVSHGGQALCGAFDQVVRDAQLCTKAMPYLLELTLIPVLAYMARVNGPALEYGSKEIEWEAERLLAGLEARVLARMRETYAGGRELGLTEEKLRAIRGETR
jgi:hypothetical protein